MRANGEEMERGRPGDGVHMDRAMCGRLCRSGARRLQAASPQLPESLCSPALPRASLGMSHAAALLRTLLSPCGCTKDRRTLSSPQPGAPGRPVNISFEMVPSGEDSFTIKQRIIVGVGPGGLVLAARSLVFLCGAEKLRFRSLRFIAVGR